MTLIVIVREGGRSSNHQRVMNPWLLDARFRGHDSSVAKNAAPQVGFP